MYVIRSYYAHLDPLGPTPVPDLHAPVLKSWLPALCRIAPRTAPVRYGMPDRTGPGRTVPRTIEYGTLRAYGLVPSVRYDTNSHEPTSGRNRIVFRSRANRSLSRSSSAITATRSTSYGWMAVTQRTQSTVSLRYEHVKCVQIGLNYK